MPKAQLIEFFRRESGKAYDPKIVTAFIDNIDRIEAAAANIELPSLSLWGSGELGASTVNLRPLEKVQPTLSYGKALDSDVRIQRELFAAFEFARTDMQCLNMDDILRFMGSKLSSIIAFDAAVFFSARLNEGVVKAEHVLGESSEQLIGLTIPLEQKLSGWVAANNASLCNLPPFPDFLTIPEPRPSFATSAIVPLHRNGHVLGTIALYRKTETKFTDVELRRLEILASQTALAISNTYSQNQHEPVLFDPLTKIPNGFQLLMMFDQVATDAIKFEYPLALFSIGIDDLPAIQKRWGYGSADEAAQLVIQNILTALGETDLLFRYSDDQLTLLSPRRNREQAEDLKSQLQDIIDHLTFSVRAETNIQLSASIGIVLFPEDENNLEKLLETAGWRMEEDRSLRATANDQRTLSLS
jgi:diguanylate cyclase (GGDEF)-like protein